MIQEKTIPSPWITPPSVRSVPSYSMMNGHAVADAEIASVVVAQMAAFDGLPDGADVEPEDQ